MRKKAKRGRLFIRRGRREVFLFAEALLLLYYSKTLLFLIPFKYAIKQIEGHHNRNVTRVANSNTSVGGHQPYPSKTLLSELKTAVRRADKFSFWSNICIVKSFAARFMLQRRGIPSTMYYGLIINNSKLEAHAWVTVGELEITPKGKSDFKIIHTL